MKYNRSKDIIFVAFHYPPIVGSSGVYRSLSFTRHLANAGYRVSVITASLKAYDNWSPKQNELIPKNLAVKRAWALSVTKHLSIKGKYLSVMSIPDNWQTWILGGFITGLWSGLCNRPKLIFSTYPVASAHIIGYLLHKILRQPWIADLRDPMVQTNFSDPLNKKYYPKNKMKLKVFQWIESKIVKHCEFVTVTTPGTKKLYLERFPQTNEDFWKLIPNGYDDNTFNQVLQEVTQDLIDSGKRSSKTLILHSGIIYPSERDPNPLFEALSALKREKIISADTLEFRLRATGHDKLYKPVIEELEIDDIVTLKPLVSYKEAIKEMTSVDAFLLMQSAGCNAQIPAKSYEYIKLKKPILGLMPKESDTGQLIDKLNIAKIAPLDQVDEIKKTVVVFLRQLSQGKFIMPDENTIEKFSRSHQAKVLHSLINNMSE